LVNGECVCTDTSKKPDENGICKCIEGTYENENHQCESCGPTCSKCRSATECEKCVEGRSLKLENGVCICEDTDRRPNEEGICKCREGTYEEGNKCVLCDETCSKCSSATQCEICKEEKGLKLVDGKCECTDSNRKPDSTGICQCIEGTYEDPESHQCVPCGKTCSKCSSATQCERCVEGRNLKLENGVCMCEDTARKPNEEGICQCLEGTYENTENHQCTPCGPTCSKCRSATECEKCIEGRSLKLENGVCICEDTDRRPNEEGICKCREGTYEEGDKCVLCDETCSKCSSATQCEICKEEKGLYLVDGKCECTDSMRKPDNNGTCQCIDGTYENEENHQCTSCNPTCSKCSSATHCEECVKERGLILENNQCICEDSNRRPDEEGICQCIDGTYENGNQCKPCDVTCSKCSSATQCEECKEGGGLHLVDNKCECTDTSKQPDENGICQCIEGTYENENHLCISCGPICSKCSSATKCEKCVEDRGLKLENDKCVCNDPNREFDDNYLCQCKVTFFEDYEDHQCKPCPVECGSCNQGIKCTTCKDPKSYISDGTCICEYGYLMNAGKCFLCDTSCETCDEHGCISCKDSTKTPNENGECE